MISEWQFKIWDEVLEVRSGRGYKDVISPEGVYPIMGSSGKVMGFANKYICEEGTTIVGRKGTIDNPLYIEEKFWNVDTAFGLHAKEELDKRYLYYFCRSFDFKSMDRGSGRPSLVKSDLLKIQIPIPPLPEQKAIVKILDEAFAKIDQAKANIEKNIENAKELFQSKLNEIFSHPSTGSGQDRGEGDAESLPNGWEEKSLKDVCEGFQYGSSSKSKAKGNIPVLRMGNIQNFSLDWSKLKYSDDEAEIKKFILVEGDVLFNRTNSPELVGKSAIYKGKMPAIFAGYLIRIRGKNKILDNEFLNYYLNSRKVREYGFSVMSSSVNQANINASKLKDYKIRIPDMSIQKTLVADLNNIESNISKSKDHYLQKLTILEELKKSLLQKAFAGELTKGMSFEPEVQNLSVVKSFDIVEGISKTDLQVGLTAIALDQHIKAKREDTFHHVKAEKIVHLAQYILNVDIDRKPVRDAAGPNDFKHSKKIESRARKAGFYTVEKHGERYNYSPGSQFQTIIDKTRSKLEGKVKLLDSLLKECLRMNTTQAEVVATLYAGWNDLIIQGSEITDENIVYASREDWHESKLEIPRERFFKALDWMKNNELFIPKGNGLLVVEKEQVK